MCLAECAGGVSANVSTVAEYKQEARVYAWENINDTAPRTEQSAAHTQVITAATVTTCHGSGVSSL